ncbi:AzlD domain-containing protein [Streptomyces sp. NPDC048639]|uniref:AzlD domain-containing protein n=1 Tax=Streptomyces sp. NPDC048639 TaxID=3365581 RepID=UPI0037220A15
MNTLSWAILGAAAVSFAFKALGPAVLGDRRLPAPAQAVIALLAPALLAGLVVVAVTGPGWKDLDLTLVAGLAAAVGARLCRAGILVAVLAGVVVTALFRLALGA